MGRVTRALGLSPQQARIVDLLLQGLKDKEIAAAMELQFSTVRTYLNRMFMRLDVDDRVELVLLVFAVHNNREPARAVHTPVDHKIADL